MRVTMKATWLFSARPKPVTCCLTVAGGYSCTGRPACGAGQEHDAAHVAEDEGGARVGGVEDVLDREGVGAKPRDEGGEPGVDVRAASRAGRAAGRGRATPISSRRWRRPSVSMAP